MNEAIKILRAMQGSAQADGSAELGGSPFD